VDIAVTAVDDRVSIRVTDTGLGIPAEGLPRLFEPLDRFGRQELGVEGTGIGSAQARRLVASMDGRLDVEVVAGRPDDRRGITRPRRPLSLLPRLGTKCVDGGAKR
jgi:signal transduction histidine kinase